MLQSEEKAMAEDIMENIVMFPVMAQGHIIPFLALALQIEQRKRYAITFVNTPFNIAKLRPSLPPASSIRLLEIPFSPADHGLPPAAENTDSLPYSLIYRLLQASASLKPAFGDLISGLSPKPLAIISDFFFPWCAEVARELGAFHAIFCGGGGFGFACYYSLWLNPPHAHSTTESQEQEEEEEEHLTLPDFPAAGKIHRTQNAPALLAAKPGDPWTKFQAAVLPKWADADAVLFNTVEEIDSIGLGYFRRKLNRPALAIGPVLLSRASTGAAGKEPGISPEKCKEWLDGKPESSVLYVSFGSQNAPSAPQMMQLAAALEASGRNFVWVLRPPAGCDHGPNFDAEKSKWVPEGFERRVAEETKRGLLVRRWAPQVEILSHGSVAAFLSHGGWNSVLEALSRGIPMIGWPMAAEQFYNVKYLEEKVGVCVEVARGNSQPVSKEEIAEKIEVVMGEKSEKGKDMRVRAREAMGMIADAIRDDEGGKGSSVKAMDEFFSAAKSLKSKKSRVRRTGQID